MRAPLSWLVYDEVEGPTVLGSGPVFICGRAEWHDDARLVVTVRGSRQREGILMEGQNPNQLARTLLRELHQATAR